MASPRALRVSRTIHALFSSKHVLSKISVNVKIVLGEEKKACSLFRVLHINLTKCGIPKNSYF